MENIVRTIVRHFVFVIITFVSLYLLVLTFGGDVNYFSWAIQFKVLFATAAHSAALMVHGYWYENR